MRHVFVEGPAHRVTPPAGRDVAAGASRNTGARWLVLLGFLPSAVLRTIQEAPSVGNWLHATMSHTYNRSGLCRGYDAKVSTMAKNVYPANAKGWLERNEPGVRGSLAALEGRPRQLSGNWTTREEDGMLGSRPKAQHRIQVVE